MVQANLRIRVVSQEPMLVALKQQLQPKYQIGGLASVLDMRTERVIWRNVRIAFFSLRA